MNLLAHGVFRGEITPLEFLADESHGWTCGAIGFDEIAAADERNSEGLTEMRIRNAELRRRNILNAVDRFAGDAEHLNPTVVRRVNRGYARLDYTGQRPNPGGELIAETRDRSGVGIANGRQIETSRTRATPPPPVRDATGVRGRDPSHDRGVAGRRPVAIFARSAASNSW